MTGINVLLGISAIGSGLLIGALNIPLMQRKIKRNHLYGMRFKKSLESDELWFDINEYGGRLFVIWSVILVALGIAMFFLPTIEGPGSATMLGIAPLIYLIPAWRTWRYSKTL